METPVPLFTRPAVKFFSVLLAFVFIDQIFKFIAIEIHLPTIIYNYGWTGGILSDSTSTIRIGILIGYYCGLWVLLLLFLNNILRLSVLARFSVILFFAGINGNMADRLRLGYVIDFIPIHLGDYYSAAFCLADVFLWVAICLMVIETWRNRKVKSPDRRIGVFVNYKLQFNLFLRISVVFCGFLFAVTGLSILLFEEMTQNLALIKSFVAIIITYGFLFEAILLSVLLSVTQRWLGPITSFIEFMKEARPGATFKIRQVDEFKELESIALKIPPRA